MKFIHLFLFFYPDCEIQEEGGSAGHMDVVESLVEGEAIEVKSNRIRITRIKQRYIKLMCNLCVL